MKDIKVIFRGRKTPSGKRANAEYMIGAKKLEMLKKDGRFEIEVLDKPIAKPKKKKAPIKEKGDK